MSDFESELEQELHRVLDPIVTGPIPTRRALATGGWRRRLLGGAGAALTVKVLTGIAVAAAAVTIAGAATEVATTGSLNPLVWGQHVKQTVAQCKDTLRASGTRGIGKCVSAIANQHGSSKDHQKASPKPKDNNGGNNGKDKGNGHGSGSDKTPGPKPKGSNSGQSGGGHMNPGPSPIPGA
jgi:hypothetical protein